MPQQYYSWTIDKATTNKDTTKEELLNITIDLMNKHHLHHNKYYKVQAFELKKPTKKYPKGRLHYHALLHSYTYSYNNKLQYTDIKKKGYSIKINLLFKPQDIADWSGYVQKDKIDKCDIILKKQISFKKDVTKRQVVKVPTIMSFYITPKN